MKSVQNLGEIKKYVIGDVNGTGCISEVIQTLAQEMWNTVESNQIDNPRKILVLIKSLA
jgi:hypothetical protein